MVDQGLKPPQLCGRAHSVNHVRRPSRHAMNWKDDDVGHTDFSAAGHPPRRHRARPGPRRPDRPRRRIHDRQRDLRAASQMAASAAPGPLLIGWAITGVGMLMLAFVFQTLVVRKPDVDGGVYGYARAGFGNYIGFTSAWGYWVSRPGSATSATSSCWPRRSATSGPSSRAATRSARSSCASVVLWVVHALTLRGVHSAAFVNTVVTIAKVVPILTFIAIAAVGFKAGIFTTDFWGHTTKIDGASLGSTLTRSRT